MVSLLVILVVAPDVYDQALRLPDRSGVAEVAFLVVLTGFLGLLAVGVLRRWRWTFWLVLLAFLAFTYRGTKIALLAEDDASKLLAFGLTAMFALQTLIIVGGVTKAIPLTGITLPFVSYGGSSVVGNFILTGLLLLVSERAGRREAEGLAYRDYPWGAP